MKQYFLLKYDGAWVSGINRASYEPTVETCDSENNALWFSSLDEIQEYGFPGGYYELIKMLVL